MQGDILLDMVIESLLVRCDYAEKSETCQDRTASDAMNSSKHLRYQASKVPCDCNKNTDFPVNK